jgi:large subunit ribosomal protein L21
VTAVIVSGGKQYRVAPGDEILVDRLDQEPGSEISFERVLLVVDEEKTEIGTPHVSGVKVGAKVLGHRRGPKIDVLRYKSKKRVRVHRGARADLTIVQIVDIGGRGAAKPAAATAEASVEAPVKAAPRARARAKVVAEPVEDSDGA